MSNYLFVYGTLKRGYGLNVILRDCKFLGRAVSCARYNMYAVGFPFLLDCDHHGHFAVGELYEVSPKVLKQCDRAESHPDMYERKLRHFVLDENKPSVKAWVYIYQHPERFRNQNRLRIQPNAEGLLEWRGQNQVELA